MSGDLTSLSGGFADPAAQSARSFRGILEAMARPGRIETLEGACPPAPLSVAGGCVLLTLADGTTPVHLDQSPLTSIYDPGNPLADTSGHYDGSNVDLVIEIADAREAQRSYDANLKLFDQARQMTQSLFDLLRR